MRVVFLARRFYPEIGGVEKHVLEIGKRMVKDGHKVLVITESPGEERWVDGIEIRRIKSPNNWFKKFYIWTWIVKNRRFIKAADVVHAHDVYYWYFPLRFIYPRKSSYLTFHGYETYPIQKGAIIMRKISELLSSGNIIVGDFIEKWYGTKPNAVIYGGVDVPRKLSSLTNNQSAVFMGRLDEHTGIMDYSKAVELIRKKYPKFEFEIMGDGEYATKLAAFHPKGFVKNPEKQLKNYNFAFVSRYLSILEALANKRLVIAQYDNPVKEDYLKLAPFSKFIVTVNSPKQIADAVEKYLDKPKEAQKMIDEGYEWVKTQTWDSVVDKYYLLWGLKSHK